MPPSWRCLLCGHRGNRKGKCKGCGEPVSKTVDEAYRRAALAEAAGLTPPNIQND